MGFDEVKTFIVEKLKEALLAIEDFFGHALSWLDRVFPPETRSSKIGHWFHVALPYLISAVVITLVLCLCRCICCGGRRRSTVRMMKAPGRNCRMPRSVFEGNPRGYFRNLRANPGDQLC